MARLCSFVSLMSCGNSECCLRCPGERTLSQGTASSVLDPSLLNPGEGPDSVPGGSPQDTSEDVERENALQSCSQLL